MRAAEATVPVIPGVGRSRAANDPAAMKDDSVCGPTWRSFSPQNGKAGGQE